MNGVETTGIIKTVILKIKTIDKNRIVKQTRKFRKMKTVLLTFQSIGMKSIKQGDKKNKYLKRKGNNVGGNANRREKVV